MNIALDIIKKLTLLSKKMDILRLTIQESLVLKQDNYSLKVDTEDKNIQKEYNTWKEDLLIKYYDPRRR